jgi:hypothetical protein
MEAFLLSMSLSYGFKLTVSLDRMNSTPYLRFLRPYACKDLPASRKAAYIRFYSLATGGAGFADCEVATGKIRTGYSSPKTLHVTRQYSSSSVGSEVLVTEAQRRGDIAQRIQELESAQKLHYPQIGHDTRALSCEDFKNRYDHLQLEESLDHEIVTLRGTPDMQ